MEINNMTPENIDDVEEFLKKLQPHNPLLSFSIFNEDENQADEVDLMTRVQECIDNQKRLETKIDRIFGNSVLINGKWVQL